MKRLAVMLFCPCLAPFLGLATIAIIFLALAPEEVYDGSGPIGPGNDMLGAFFTISCGIVGVISQVVIGIPFCFAMMNIRSRFWRIVLAVDVALIPLVLFGIMIRDMPLVNETMVAVLLIAALFGIGAWIPFKHLQPLPR